QGSAARTSLDIVIIGPRRDRHRAERVAGHDRPLAVSQTGLKHRFEVLSEALHRVVVLGRGLAAAVTALVVGDNTEAAVRQSLDHVGPEAQRLGPTVGPLSGPNASA